MSDIAIRVEGLGKQYRIGGAQGPGRARYKSLRESLSNGALGPFRAIRSLVSGNGASRGPKFGTIWALKDVSFEVKRGEVVGVIGRNGSGKSTLLKVLSRITEPTEGRAEVHGRVGSLLEVGTGFHPELTGRENIYLSGAILGMKGAEIGRKFDEIVDFSETEKFLDTPVKYYSSGMQMRLAFSVAAHLDPETLLVDEVLAVGDAEFQKKCLGKMSAVAIEGRTVLFVSHNMAAVIALCPIACLLQTGNLIAYGETDSVLMRYLTESGPTSTRTPLGDRGDRAGNQSARLYKIMLRDGQHNPCETFLSGQACFIEATAIVRSPASQARCLFGLYDLYGRQLALLDSSVAGLTLDLRPGTASFVCHIPRLPICPGRYVLNIALINGEDIMDHVISAADFTVAPGDFYGTGRLPEYGPFLFEQLWSSETTL